MTCVSAFTHNTTCCQGGWRILGLVSGLGDEITSYSMSDGITDISARDRGLEFVNIHAGIDIEPTPEHWRWTIPELFPGPVLQQQTEDT